MSIFTSFLFKPLEDGGYSFTTPGYITFILLCMILLLFASAFSKKREQKLSINTKNLAFCGVSLALATVTSMIKIFHFPFGGSITLLSMLFVCLIGYFFGPKTGIIAAIAHGILQMFIDPVFYYPLQIVMDYILAFGSLGLAGLFWKRKHGLVLGYLLGITCRWFFAALSGYLFWAEYAWDGWNTLAYTMVYNGIYIFSEGIITIIFLSLPPVKNSIQRIKNMYAQ